MSLGLEIRKRAKHVVGPLVAICVAGYFAYHAFEGDRGLVAMAALEHDLDGLKTELATLQAERAKLESRVNLLHPEHLDRDMLDERARIMLDYGYPDDVIVILDK